jgi:Zn-dependent protease
MENLIYYIFLAIALVIAITIHEYSHALAADRLGDPTPRSLGRLSLNPLRHLDPLGTLMIFVLRFGWGKPVPIDAYNLKNPRRDELIIALAGPVSNLILATIFSLLANFIPQNFILLSFVFTLIQINIILAVFNLLPIPPLDGSKIFLNLLPVDTSIKWQEAFDRFGIIILLVTLFIPIYNQKTLIDLVLAPTVNLISQLLLPL